MSIRASKKHGVNPCMGLCYFCGQETGTIGLLGRLPDDAEAPRFAVLDRQPCATCADYMKKGIMLIAVADGEPEYTNRTDERGQPVPHEPHRTGPLAVITEDAARRMFQPPELLADVLRRRVCWVEASAWKAAGLPEGTVEPAPPAGGAP